MLVISDLPLESFIEILLKTDGRTLGICRRVSKNWKEIIDSSDFLWQAFSKNDFPNSSNIARKKSGKDMSWYYIYKNLKTWHKIANIDKTMKEFYKFTLHDKAHALEIDNGILPLKDTRGIVLYDMHTLRNVPVVVPEKNCFKVSHNDYASAILIKSGLLIQRTVTNPDYMSEAFFKADNFVLSYNALYFFNNREVFKCDLMHQILASKLVLNCDYDIKVMQYNNNALYLFTDCGKIVTIENDVFKTVKPVNIPAEWLKQDNLDPQKKTFTDNKLSIYKRLLRLKDRLQCQTF
ncbi:hypothetical protein MSG28_015741 [Choristoneura fumiferana]|uniref:Uncharacterized protein n=1 Tax=Choristoneura fumiferana TaxID=7141 RepID=A0ACC0KB68_CHOFU|nr:hypothetical protein MSG28_015741 [Choristoneura fumiferana]